MKAIVHIGMSKAGSTALQNCLLKSGEYLSTVGLLYPRNPEGCRFNNHRLLAAQFLEYRNLPRHMKNRALYTADNIDIHFNNFVETVERQIRTQKPDCVILSSETLFRKLPRPKHDAIRRTYDRFGAEPRFMVYLRKPSEHYLSSLQQTLKMSASIKLPRPREYRRSIESYDACFGVDAVSARLFHRDHLENADVIADFCRHYLAEFAVDPAMLHAVGRPNESLAAESMDLVARYRRAFHRARDNVPSTDTSQLRAALVESERAEGAVRPRLWPGVAEMIDYASPDCLWIRDRFGLMFPGLDYDRLAGRPGAIDIDRSYALEELVVIDRALQVRILDRLAVSPWAQADPARREWIRTVSKASAGASAKSRAGAADDAPRTRSTSKARRAMSMAARDDAQRISAFSADLFADPEGPGRSFLLETPHYFLDGLLFGDDQIVVTFETVGAGRDMANGHRPEWGRKALEKREISSLCVKPKTSNWYRPRDLAAAFEGMRDAGFLARFGRVITYGGSMGGFGALAYAGLLGARTAVAMNPQTTLDLGKVPWESRFKRAQRQKWRGAFSDAAETLGGVERAYVILDPWHRDDRRQAVRLTSPDVTFLHLPFVGHKIPAHLLHIGALDLVLDGMLAGAIPEAEFRARARRRRRLRRYFETLKAHPRVLRSTRFQAIVARHEAASPLLGEA